MQHYKDLMKNQLEVNVDARERVNKNKAIARVVCNENIRFGMLIEGKTIDETRANKRVFLEVLTDILALDRAWRKVTEENEGLRGTDYGDKEVLEQEVQLALGYTPGLEADKKKLDTL